VTPLTIPVTGGRSSQSPPSRHQTALLKLPATSDSAGGFRGASASPIKQQQQPPTPAPPDYLGGLTNGVEGGGGGGSAHRNNNNNNKHNSSSSNNNTVRLGSSPFWCGVGSRDPLSRYKKTFLELKKRKKNSTFKIAFRSVKWCIMLAQFFAS
jgi:hypothetical protein